MSKEYFDVKVSSSLPSSNVPSGLPLACNSQQRLRPRCESGRTVVRLQRMLDSGQGKAPPRIAPPRGAQSPTLVPVDVSASRGSETDPRVPGVPPEKRLLFLTRRRAQCFRHSNRILLVWIWRGSSTIDFLAVGQFHFPYCFKDYFRRARRYHHTNLG
jgi:hypothetical protein